MSLKIARILVLAIEDLYADKVRKVEKGKKVAFRLYTSTKLEEVINKTASQSWQISRDALQFDFLGTIVKGHETLEDLQIRDGDIITVRNRIYSSPASRMSDDFKQLVGSSYGADFTLKVGQQPQQKKNNESSREGKIRSLSSSLSPSVSMSTTPVPMSIDADEDQDQKGDWDCDYKEIPVHRIILRSRSEKFRAMFDSGMKENQLGFACIPHHHPKIFMHLLEYLYTDDTTANTVVELVPLLSLADEYLLPRLQRLCELKLIKLISIENVLELVASIDRSKLEDLAQECSRFITDHASEFKARTEAES